MNPVRGTRCERPRGAGWLLAAPAAVWLLALPGCLSCGVGGGGTDAGQGGTDAGNLPGDSAVPECTSFDDCGPGLTCSMGACVPCPVEGCPLFTSIPLPTTGVVFWTFASAGSLGTPITSPAHSLVGVLGQSSPLPAGADFAQESATHVNHAGFASALVSP